MSNAQLAVAADQLDIFAWHGSKPSRAFGEIYDPRQDGAKFGEMALDIFRLLADGRKWTLPQIGQHVSGLSTSHSARIRSIRDWLEETGRGTIERDNTETRGLHTYQIIRAWPIKGRHYQ